MPSIYHMSPCFSLLFLCLCLALCLSLSLMNFYLSFTSFNVCFSCHRVMPATNRLRQFLKVGGLLCHNRTQTETTRSDATDLQKFPRDRGHLSKENVIQKFFPRAVITKSLSGPYFKTENVMRPHFFSKSC